MANMELINKVTVGSGGIAAIEFTGIPQTYTDLVVKLSGRSSRSAATAEEFLLTFNNNGTGYSEQQLRGDGASVIAQTFSGSSIQQVAQPGAGATANTFGSWEFYIPNYTGSNNKSISLDGVTENNATTAYAYLEAGLWANSAAITSIKISAGSYLAVEYSTAYLYGVSNVTTAAKASGGTITSDGAYFYHTFTSSGTFTPTTSLTADYLVVAGGGGGGFNGGGAGAGGYRTSIGGSPLSLTATAYTVTIGAGGIGGVGPGGSASFGSDSVFSTITSSGGGTGGLNFIAGGNGGSGGGGGRTGTTTAGGTGNTPSTSPSQGNNGGGGAFSSGIYYSSGGGGGASTAGASASGAAAGNGGAGSSNSISGTSVIYAGGGGGGADTSSGETIGIGGAGGGGNGGGSVIGPVAGSTNTGGGGGGCVPGFNGANGGSGIVIVRYAV
jgi:hypothetical protein